MLAVVIVAGTAVEVKLFVEVFVIAMRKKARKPDDLGVWQGSTACRGCR